MEGLKGRLYAEIYKVFTVVLGVLFITENVYCVHVPKFEVPPPESQYRLGKDAVLKCTVTNIGGRTIIWRKLSDPFPISIGTNKFDPSSKYRIKQTGEDWLLTIKRLDRSDGGDYECRASGSGNHATTISLIIPGDDTTHFVPTLADISASISDTVVLPCKVNHLKKFKVAWLDQQGEVISLRKKIINGDQRLKIIHTVREEWSLQIKRITENDFGRYTCLVNSDPVISRSILIKNTGPSLSPPFLNLPTKKVEVTEGETVNLECLFQGFPEPKVSWHRRIKIDNKKVKEALSHRGMVLKIENVQPKDRGDYYCTGKNGVKPLSRGKIKLFVKALPITVPPPTTPFVPTGPAGARVRVVAERVGQRKGRDVYLECIVIGQPYPTVYWKRHKTIIQRDFKHMIYHTKHNDYTHHTKLRVRSIGVENYGDYECVGVNGIGTDTAVVHLYETR